MPQRVYIRWLEFHLRGVLKYECPYDSVRIYDGPSLKSDKIGIFCIRDFPDNILSSRSVSKSQIRPIVTKLPSDLIFIPSNNSHGKSFFEGIP